MLKKKTQQELLEKNDEESDYEDNANDMAYLLTPHQKRDRLDPYDSFDYLNERN